ncbi:hypothetical protein RJ640_000136 [Escallonia rubra]|uniref:Cytochrome P450 n=1 Tax=Escallonia rubra TaxID=112253 RepID=A0AA88QP27_9ASTE|nr:hypothetical protein RJ640_000136 [Escallonia rubra]
MVLPFLGLELKLDRVSSFLTDHTFIPYKKHIFYYPTSSFALLDHMDLTLSCLLLFGLLYASFSLFFNFRKKSPPDQRYPPGNTGWPFIGESLEYVASGRNGTPDKFVRERMDKFSPEVFKTSIAGETVAVFCGAAGNKFLFSNENKLVASWMPSTFLKIINAKKSETGAILQGKRLRSMLPEFLKPEALQKYLPVMDRMAMQHLERDWSVTAAITFVVCYLADHPDVLRIQPVAPGTFRKVIKDFTYAGFKIPKEWKAFWSVYSTHKDPNYFPNPEKFDPSRFEGNGPVPYSFVPFGGGPRMCPGNEYARLEVLIFMHRLVTKFKWKRLNPNEKIIIELSPVPFSKSSSTIEKFAYNLNQAAN